MQKPYALENEFSRAHAEINNKQQLPASEAAKTEGMKQSTSLPILAGLDWQHHLDAVLGPQRTALVPSTESSEANTNHGMEIDRLQKELENANSQYLELSAGSDDFHFLSFLVSFRSCSLSGSKCDEFSFHRYMQIRVGGYFAHLVKITLRTNLMCSYLLYYLFCYLGELVFM